ncbi:hypothetical protein F2Q69_00021135 [Brassica cretica]|uniref:Uncharacterized protein n=1 Tax=Brassica cretica TaxID=69181 RepID=A0A8S9QRC9_BRACR|nr:hypothetical protein F2Q69_00021135 [Brassica cretica]
MFLFDCWLAGWPFISNPGCWTVDRSCSCLIVGRLIDHMSRTVRGCYRHVFGYTDITCSKGNSKAAMQVRSAPYQNEDSGLESETASVNNMNPVYAALDVSTGFQLGTSQSRLAGDSRGGKKQRRCPPSWKRKTIVNVEQSNSEKVASGSILPADSFLKRKSSSEIETNPTKNLKTQANTVASDLNPLPPQ